MEAPDNSSQTTADDGTSSGQRRSPRLPQLPPVIRLWTALIIFVAASLVTIFQSPRPDAFRRPRALFSLSWWRYPLEWNAPSRLPKIDCGLNAIYAVPNTSDVWAVGNKGMVVVSHDGGVTWTKRGIEENQIVAASPSPSPSPSLSLPSPSPSSTRNPAAQSFLSFPDLVPTVSAAETPREEPQAQRGTPETAKPTATVDPKAPGGPMQSSLPTPTPKPGRPSLAGPIQSTTPGRRNVAPSVSHATPQASVSPHPLGPVAQHPPSENPTTPVEDESLIAIHFEDANRGEAFSSLGTRLTTINGGVNWLEAIEYVVPNYTYDAKDPSGPGFAVGTSLPELAPSMGERPPTSHTLLFRALDTHVDTTGEARYFAVDEGGNLSELRRRSSTLAEIGNEPLREINNVSSLHGQMSVCAVSAEGKVFRSNDGSDWKELQRLPTYNLHGVFFINESRGWVTSTNGAIFSTNNGGANWQPQESWTLTQLNSINFLSDGQHGWIAGQDGLILSTDDGGATWVHRTQGKDAAGRYLRFPAPWYFLVLLVTGVTLLRRTKQPAPPPEESVADVLISDRPLDTPSGDMLAFNSIALGLSRFLRNENTLAPLTIAIIGEWGTGKSSLMNLLRVDLRSYKFRPVWFNAWHHQKEEHMLASLLENIKLQAVPRWWTSRGVIFRARLLKIRGWRHWLPLLLLLFLIYVMAIYYLGALRAGAGAGDLFNNLSTLLSKPTEAATGLVKWLPLIAGVAAFLGAVWRGITAFGVKPASLLAGVSRGVSIRGLEAQTSFRQKFAVEFDDVTRALGERSLLIFIDDLDRCRPDNVLETLEAVNFLTTSGNCFVVIGMAREYVERCVGRAFKDIAEEMIDDVPEAKPSPQRNEEQLKEELAKEKRIEFARQYLDKLINIEVPVPTAKTEQSLRLLLAGAEQHKPSVPKTQLEEMKLWCATAARRHWKVVPAMITLGGLLVIGYLLAQSVIPNPPVENAASAISSPTPDLRPSPSPTAAPIVSSSRAKPSPTPVSTPTPLPTPTPTNERAEIVAGGRGLISRNVLPVIALLGLTWFGVTILTRRPGAIVKDSPRFVEALKVWHSVIFARQCTPRATKRFMNHVRYLAMRQRKPVETQSLLNRLAPPPSPDASSTVPGTDDSETKSIPDDALVALAAMEHFKRECLLESDYSSAWPRVVGRDSQEIRILESALAAHIEKFGSFDDVMQYRQWFLEMSASIEVR